MYKPTFASFLIDASTSIAAMISTVTNAISKLPQILLDSKVLNKGSRLLIVASNNAKNRAPFNQTMLALQKKNKFQCVPFLSPSGCEAKIETVEDGVLMAQKTGCEGIVSVGGGSIIDMGKMISAILTNGGSVYDYVKHPKANTVTKELFQGNHNAILNVAVPTLLGSGSELSKHAVLLYPAEEKAITFSHDLLQPNVVVADKTFVKGASNALESAVAFANFARSFDLYISNLQSNESIDDSEASIQSIASLEASKLYLSTLTLSENYTYSNDEKYDILAGASFQSAYALNLSSTGLSISARVSQTICGLFSVPYANVHSAVFLPLLKARIENAKTKMKAKDMEFLTHVQSAAASICDDPNSSVDALIHYLEDIYRKLGLKSMKELGLSRTDSELATSLIFTENDLEDIQLLGRDRILDIIVEDDA